MGMPMVARKWKEDKSTFESRGSFMRGVVDGGWPTCKSEDHTILLIYSAIRGIIAFIAN